MMSLNLVFWISLESGTRYQSSPQYDSFGLTVKASSCSKPTTSAPRLAFDELTNLDKRGALRDELSKVTDDFSLSPLARLEVLGDVDCLKTSH